MREIKEILRLHFEVGLSNRGTAQAPGGVPLDGQRPSGPFQVAELNWPLPEDLERGAQRNWKVHPAPLRCELAGASDCPRTQGEGGS